MVEMKFSPARRFAVYASVVNPHDTMSRNMFPKLPCRKSFHTPGYLARTRWISAACCDAKSVLRY